MLLAEEKLNTKRQYEFDFAKAFAVFAMIIVHVYECISEIENYGNCHADVFDSIIQFIAGPLAAPVFMIAMGIGMVYSSHNTPKELAKRGLHLFIFAYILSVFRYLILYSIFATSAGVFSWDLFFCFLFRIDILQFAGLSFLLTALLKKLKVPVLVMEIIALAMQIAGYYLGKIEIQGYSQYFFGLFFSASVYSYFPLLIWYIYPVIGIILAKYLRHVSNTDKFYKGALIFAATIFVALGFTLNAVGYNLTSFYVLEGDAFYNQNFITVVLTLCVVLIELSLFHFIHKLCKSEKVLRVVYFLSNNLNTIYIFQWLIIGNLMIIFPFCGLTPISKYLSIPVGLLIAAISIGLTLLVVKIKAKNKASKEHKIANN